MPIHARFMVKIVRCTRPIPHCILAILVVLAAAIPALAWNDEGHMAVAYLAYQRLRPSTRERVDSLLKLNPYYAKWLATIPANVSKREINLRIFMIAATWADQIRGDPEYQDDGRNGGNTPEGPEASLNVGYADHLRHKYWHFIDIPFATDGTALPLIPAPNIQTQITTFGKILATDERDEVKSYDMVWLEHLVGDVHQPLHAVARVGAASPTGDAGGNTVRICFDPCRDNLHSFWDRLVGSQSHLPQAPPPSRPPNLPLDWQAEIESAERTAKTLPAPDKHLTEVLDPAAWAKESFDLAQSAVYVPPIGPGLGPFDLREDYLMSSQAVAGKRVGLAGARLANLLNVELR
jgi:hypothetical protein